MTLRAKLVLLLVTFAFFVFGSVGSVWWAISLYVDASFNQFARSSGLIDRVDRLRTELAVDLGRSLDAPTLNGPLISRVSSGLIEELIQELNTYSGPAGASMVRNLVDLRTDLQRCDALLRLPQRLPRPAILSPAFMDRVEAMLTPAWNRAFAEPLIGYARTKASSAIPGIKRELSRHGRTAAASGDRVQWNVQIMLVVNIVAAVVLAAIVVAMVQRWIARPIADLQTSSERFAEGDLSHRCPVRGRDELGRLAGQVNEMASRLLESQRQLVERERMAAVGELCSAVAHGIRNPLSAIASSAELILQQSRVDDPTRSRLNDVLAESERLNQRVSRLLEFSRTTRISTQVLLVDDLAEQAADEMVPHLERKGIRLVRELGHPAMRIRGDREMIINAVIELLSNASDQQTDLPEVELRSGRRDGYATICVRDHGPGFKERSIERVFDLFFTTKVNGTGIGLSSVRKTAQMHAGRVRIDNVPDGGAVVTLEIPECAGGDSAVD